MKYVIIGGDAAGMSAASRIKRSKPDSSVIVFEKTEDVSYSACGMPYNIADSSLPVSDLVVRSAEVFREKQNIDLRTGYEVLKIDASKKQVVGINSAGETFSESYDKLLIATGGDAVIPDVEGMDLPGVFALKKLEDARTIKSWIAENNVAKAVIIGMGYIGFEMAESLTSQGIKVTMVKEREQFMPWMVPELAAHVKEHIESNGVTLRPGLALKNIESKNGRLTVNAGDSNFDADMVIVGIGVKPVSNIAKEAGLMLGASNSIAINSHMQTSDADIYSAGDCAEMTSVVSGKKIYVPLALTANRGGRIAAGNMMGKSETYEGIAGTGVFKVFEYEVARTGLTEKEAVDAGFDPAYKVVKTKSKAHVYPGAEDLYITLLGDKKSGKLLGAQLCGQDGVAHRVNAVAVALQAKMSVKEFSECDLGYAPPFSPVWDPTLTAANQLIKELK